MNETKTEPTNDEDVVMLDWREVWLEQERQKRLKLRQQRDELAAIRAKRKRQIRRVLVTTG